MVIGDDVHVHKKGKIWPAKVIAIHDDGTYDVQIFDSADGKRLKLDDPGSGTFITMKAG